jgi:hypothetical protein
LGAVPPVQSVQSVQVEEDGATMSCRAFAKASIGFDPENRGRGIIPKWP